MVEVGGNDEDEVHTNVEILVIDNMKEGMERWMLDMEQMSRIGGGKNSKMCAPIGKWLMKLKFWLMKLKAIRV
jgi:hypothetical protein